MIQERVKSGLDRAREQGKILGRPKVSSTIELLIHQKRNQGMGILKIAREVGVGTSVVQRVLKAA
jgi:DNA invertase Pin-like site-specific DNA recombinase